MTDQHTVKLSLSNRLGLHTRAASVFVEQASAFDCTIRVLANGKKADGSSIIGLMMLAVPYQGELEIIAQGKDAQEALQKLTELINQRFGEPE